MLWHAWSYGAEGTEAVLYFRPTIFTTELAGSRLAERVFVAAALLGIEFPLATACRPVVRKTENGHPGFAFLLYAVRYLVA